MFENQIMGAPMGLMGKSASMQTGDKAPIL
jgi:hypothetical protein